jgi:hypothetical protein
VRWSFRPLPLRTVISRRSRSKSLTRSTRAVQLLEHTGDLSGRRDGWHVSRGTRADQGFPALDGAIEHVLVQKDDRAQSLAVGRSANAAFTGELVEIGSQFRMSPAPAGAARRGTR